MQFTWDARKAQSNFEKHNVQFEVAVEVFLDPNIVTVADERNDYGEARLVSFGLIGGRMHTVVHVTDLSKRTVRIISARKSNKRERKRYGTG